MSELIAGLTGAVDKEIDRPYALYGHCFGALMAFELAHELRRRAMPAPVALVVSGRGAPHRSSHARESTISGLPDDAFLDAIAADGGLSKELLQDSEMRSLLLPALRADIGVADGYTYVPGELLAVPIVAIEPLADGDPFSADVVAWGQLTTAGLRLGRVDLDPSYVHQPPPSILAAIRPLLSIAPASQAM